MKLLPLLLAFALPAATAQDVAGLRRAYSRAESSYQARVALDKLEAAYAGAEEAGRAGVTATVCKALESEYFDVRAHAANMLGAGLDREPAIEALVRAARGLERESRALAEEARRRSRESMEILEGSEDVVEKMEELRRFSRTSEGVIERAEAFVEFRAALVTALRLRGDDRCVDGLGDVLASVPLGTEADPVVDALLELGTGPALRHVVRSFDTLEEVVEDREKARKKLARTRPEKVPRGWRDTDKAWEAREAQRIADMLANFDEQTTKAREWAHGLHLRLHEFAGAKDLPAPPTSALGYRPWKEWLGQAAPLLPEHTEHG